MAPAVKFWVPVEVAGPTGAVAATRYAGATASGAPASGTFLKGDFVIAQNGHLFVCTAAGTPGTWVDVGGSGAVLSVFGRTGAVVAATNDYSEAQLSFTDITTNDVSTSKHGFAPKGDGTTTKFLNANGAYSTPAGTGAATAGASELVYRYTVVSTDKASIDTGVDTADAGTADWTNGDLLEVFFYSRTDEVATLSVVNVTVNNDTGSVYDLTFVEVFGTTSAFGNTRAGAKWQWDVPGANAASNNFGDIEIRIPNYMSTVGDKQGAYSMGFADATSAVCITDSGNVRYRPASPAAVSRIKFVPNTALKKFKVGTQLLVYKRRAS